MNVENIIIDEYLPKIGGTSLAIYILIQRNKGQIKLSEICSILQISRPTAIKERNKLIDIGLIKMKSKKREKFKPLEYKKLEKIKHIPSSPTRVKEVYSSLYNIIINYIFNNKRSIYYNLKIPKFSNNILNNITNLLDNSINSEAKVKDMCNWWLETKTDKDFNFGFFCCDSIIREYTINKRSRVSQSEVLTSRKVDNKKFKTEILEDILKKKREKKKLYPEEEEILKRYNKSKGRTT